MVLRRLARAATGAVVGATTLAALGASTSEEHGAPAAEPTPAEGRAERPREPRARAAYAAAPLAFEANRGQTDAAVRYVARGSGMTVFLTRTAGATFDLQAPGRARGAAVELELVGADTTPRIAAGRDLQAPSTYFVGAEARRERAVPTFAEVGYQDVYPGIDLELGGDRSGVTYAFEVEPGADPAAIGFRLRGAEALHVDRSGDLVSPPPSVTSGTGPRWPINGSAVVAGR